MPSPATVRGNKTGGRGHGDRQIESRGRGPGGTDSIRWAGAVSHHGVIGEIDPSPAAFTAECCVFCQNMSQWAVEPWKTRRGISSERVLHGLWMQGLYGMRCAWTMRCDAKAVEVPGSRYLAMETVR